MVAMNRRNLELLLLVQRVCCFLLVFTFAVALQAHAKERQHHQPASSWGYINQSNVLSLPAKFDVARDFSEGIAHVVDKNGSHFIKLQNEAQLQTAAR